MMTTWADPQGKVLHDGVSLSLTVCHLQQNHQHILWEKKAFTKAKKKCNKRTYLNSLGTQNERKQLIWLNQPLKTAFRWLVMYWLYGRIFFYRAWKNSYKWYWLFTSTSCQKNRKSENKTIKPQKLFVGSTMPSKLSGWMVYKNYCSSV